MIALRLGLVALLLLGERADVASTGAVYVRTDTDRTTVTSPRVHFRTTLDEERHQIDAVYTADVWTSASVDIRTAATAAVTEGRHEVDFGYAFTRDTVRIGATYRMSYEPDYLSNGVSLVGRIDAFQRNTTFDLRITGAYDRVGRAGDETFAVDNGAGSGYLGWTQVLGKKTVLQLSGEIRGQRGYLASPYRFVSIDGAGSCASAAGLCVPEHHPDLRVRGATALRLRQGLGKRWSIGGAYRFYVDDWGLLAHTIMADGRVAVRPMWTLGLEYRAYRQNAATFYRERYASASLPAFVTRDRELSAMGQHRVATWFDGRIETRRGPVVHVGTAVAGTYLGYDAFIGLARVWALEVSALVGVEI